jgi:ABC-type phosphate/phosphonate transport system substrate-binding protein
VALRPVGPTGSHRASAQAVAAGEADLAAIDAVTWRMLERWEPVAVGLRVVALTAPTPGLPLIAARGADAPRLFGAVAGAIAAMPAADRSLTGLAGLVAIPAQDYLALPVPPLPAPGVAPG